MFVNTGGGGKTQQQQPLQNQTNASVRHNNPYQNPHTQQQPHYDHHQGPVTFVTYPFCNIAQAAHGNTGGNNVAVGGGQAGHVLYQAPHQPQSQPHPPQQQVGLHNTEQTLHYFTKTAPLSAHHLHHTPQQHSQIRNIIAVSHQRQPYMVSPNYYALTHAALLPPQPRASILTNAAPQHSVGAASSGSMAAQIQNTTPRSVAPSGPAAYVPPPYCTPPLMLGAAPTAVTSQPAPMLAAATGIGQPPPLQAYPHIGGGLSAAPTSSTPISMQTVGLGVGASLNSEHNTNTIQRKQRLHAIPIIHPVTREQVKLVDDQPKSQPQTQLKSEINVESVSIQTDNDKSLTTSIASDPSDVVLATISHSLSATETDKIDCQTENEENEEDNYEIGGLAIATTTFISAPEANTATQSLHSGSESLKMCACEEDPNDTDADTNEHELDNEDDVLDATDGNLSTPYTNQQSPTNISIEKQTEELPNTDIVILKAGASDTDHSTETDVKSKDEPYTVSVQTSLDKNDEEKSKGIHPDLEPSMSSYVVSESKKGRRNRKGGKRKDKYQKKTKQQQQNKSSNMSTQNEENKSKMLSKTTGADSKVTDQPKKEKLQPRLLRYSLEELKDFANSPESCKTPVVPCQKGDCISQLFVARQQHHHLLSQVGQNLTAINLQSHVQQSYHHMNFNESIELVSGNRRLGAAGVIPRKHQEHHMNSASAGNNNIAGLQLPAGSAGACGNMTQIQKKMQVIRINLSLNEEIKLSECKNAWQPKFLSNYTNKVESCKNGNDDIEDVLKKVRGILNKLTSENFDVLVKEITNITINTPEKMEKFMLLIFEKTVSEPNFAPTYAKFSKVLFEDAKAESKEIFNSLLIKRLEKEFELNVNNADAKERKLQQIIDKLKITKDPQEKVELQAELEHQEYQFRRRAWGTVRFIGEMYKLHSLSANRVFLYVESLLKHGNEEKLEYMCKLLTTVGNLLESSGDTETFNNNNARMNKIFTKIQTIVKDTRDPSNKKTKICSRVRFMMQDLIDLRSRNWGQSPYAHSSHTALRRRQPEDKSNNLLSSSSSTYERGSSQRMSFGNNNRHNQTRAKESGVSGSGGNYFMQQQKSTKSQYLAQREQHSIDLKKLNFSRGDDSSQATTKLGNKSIYMWRTITGRQTNQSIDSQQSDRNSPTSPQSNTSHQHQQKHQPQQQTQYWGSKKLDTNCDIKAILESCSSKDNQKLLNHLLEEYLDCSSSRSNRWREEVLNAWQKTNNKQQICLVYYILIDFLHLSTVTRLERNACAHIFIYLMNCKAFNKTTFTRAYEQFAEEFPDLLMDVPNGWTYVFQFLGPLLHERSITFSDIWYTHWRSDPLFTDRFVNALVVYFTKEFGANYMRDLWHKEFKLDRGQLFKSDQQQWHQFVTANKFQFLYDCNAKPEITPTNINNNSPAIMDQHVQRLEVLLSSPNDSNLALDYINTNVNINSYFLKNLIRFLCCDYATTTKTTITTRLSRTSSATISKNSSTCSNSSSSSSTKNPDYANSAQLNIDAFRKNCLPLLRLCLDAHEDNELACLDSVVDAIQQEYDTHTADELISGIFDVFYDCEVIAKESFEKWYKQRQQKQKKHKQQLSSNLEAFLQKLL